MAVTCPDPLTAYFSYLWKKTFLGSGRAVLAQPPERSRPPMSWFSAPAPSTGVPEFHSLEVTAAWRPITYGLT